MITYTGKEVDPLNLQPEDVSLQDVAHALSMICRWGGHVRGHLSVATHSLNVAHHLKCEGHGPDVQLQGLLHDAAEAYLGDMLTEIKYRADLTEYRVADHRATEVIFGALGCPYPMHSAVKESDRYVQAWEKACIDTGSDKHWRFTDRSTMFVKEFHRLKWEISDTRQPARAE